MLKHIFAIAVLTAGMAFAENDPGMARINKEVRHELVMLPYLDVFDNLTYRVDGFNVTLAGQVTRPTLKKDAERVVKSIDGVETVDNQIEILPLSPNDDRLRHSLYRAIYGYPTLNRYALEVIKPIRIIVKNGPAKYTFGGLWAVPRTWRGTGGGVKVEARCAGAGTGSDRFAQ